ncbi:hypothetical protein SAMN05192562_1027 [Kosakonia arachidis]|uniref:Uncharacterized protein n=1 Tax=Kosakonia arachidis TaxID=551989 RepID=A0A1I7AQG9_9ENTR|nr:hypothetical protein SAMN05192562_1027 [Kosakonia arachidis]
MGGSPDGGRNTGNKGNRPARRLPCPSHHYEDAATAKKQCANNGCTRAQTQKRRMARLVSPLFRSGSYARLPILRLRENYTWKRRKEASQKKAFCRPGNIMHHLYDPAALLEHVRGQKSPLLSPHLTSARKRDQHWDGLPEKPRLIFHSVKTCNWKATESSRLLAF